MHKNLKSFYFIVAAATSILAAWRLLDMSTNTGDTIEHLTFFAWGIFWCMRIDEQNRKEKEKDS